MKFKKMFSIVLMTVLCFGIMNERVFADDVTNENIASEVKVAEALAGETLDANTQLENDLKNQSIKKQFDEIFNFEFEADYTAEPIEYAAAKTVPMGTTKYKESDLRLLSSIIYCEAQGESYAGKLAVGIVVMNRMSSKDFPNTISKVVYQKNQFQPTRNGSLKKALAKYDSGKFTSTAEKQCIKAAKEALSGTKTVTHKSKKINLKGFHFFSGYLKGYRVKIGNHKFK